MLPLAFRWKVHIPYCRLTAASREAGNRTAHIRALMMQQRQRVPNLRAAESNVPVVSNVGGVRAPCTVYLGLMWEWSPPLSGHFNPWADDRLGAASFACFIEEMNGLTLGGRSPPSNCFCMSDDVTKIVHSISWFTERHISVARNSPNMGTRGLALNFVVSDKGTVQRNLLFRKWELALNVVMFQSWELEHRILLFRNWELALNVVMFQNKGTVAQNLTMFQSWELLVLSKLKWDIAAVTPQDFLQHILVRLPIDRNTWDAHMIHRHAQTFIALSTRDYSFSMYTPSIIAAASIAAALDGLEWTVKSGCSLSQLLDRLHIITAIEREYLQGCLHLLEDMVTATVNSRDVDCNGGSQGNGCTTVNSRSTLDHSSPLSGGTEKIAEYGKAGTPTDVRDIHF
ncbi:hypothetical protein B7P43_G05663 [Cryptotermes secundus]|uniref:Cyclin C-terminal domain-containing protein n=1 Tax=Cryptotermes secundus TaxID=105785 RepID=A0A2J7RFT5_9NEOP|nr:hypothetical protein B7P43_G05663 [Cryptotermes secundus]